MQDNKNQIYSDRATNEPTPTQIHELGDNFDIGETFDASVGNKILTGPYETFNMESFTLEDVLTREYPVTTLTWTSAQAAGSTLGYYYPLGTLLANTYVSQKLAMFKYFRAGLRITVRVVSQRFNYGSFVVNYEPYTGNATPRCTTLSTVTGLPHVIMSASAADAVTLEVPFIHPNRVINLSTDSGGIQYNSEDLGFFTFTVLNPLTDIQDLTGQAQIFTTLSFVNAQAMYPYTTQMKKAPKSKKTHPEAQEAKKKAESGTISRTLETVSSLAGMASSVPVIGPYANVFSGVAGTASRVAKMFGFNKPNTTAITNITKINPFVDINQGMGMSLTTKFGLDPENGIGTEPNVGGIPIDEMSISAFAGTPRWINTVTVTPSSSASTLDQLTPTSNAYCDQIAPIFQSISGSWKYMLHICASQFHNVKLVVWLNNASASATTGWQNCYHKIIDVQGDTVIKFRVPILTSGFVYPTGELQRNSLNVSVLAWSQPDMAINCPVYFNVYKAGAEDFAVYGLLDYCTVSTQLNPRGEFAADFEPFHGSFEGYTVEGLVYGERIDSIRDIIHKEQPIADYSYTGSASFDYDGMTFSGSVYRLSIEAWSRWFAFWRGSIRMRYLPYTDDVSVAFRHSGMVTDGSTRVYAGTIISSQINPQLEVEIPYYYLTAYQLTRSNTNRLNLGPNLNFIPSGGGSYWQFKGAGDDFSFHFIWPSTVSMSTIPNSSVRFGSAAFNNFTD